jgi:hypothetical protein
MYKGTKEEKAAILFLQVVGWGERTGTAQIGGTITGQLEIDPTVPKGDYP